MRENKYQEKEMGIGIISFRLEIYFNAAFGSGKAWEFPGFRYKGFKSITLKIKQGRGVWAHTPTPPAACDRNALSAL